MSPLCVRSKLHVLNIDAGLGRGKQNVHIVPTYCEAMPMPAGKGLFPSDIDFVCDNFDLPDAHCRDGTPFGSAYLSKRKTDGAIHFPNLTPLLCKEVSALITAGAERPSAEAISEGKMSVRPSARIARMWL